MLSTEIYKPDSFHQLMPKTSFAEVVANQHLLSLLSPGHSLLTETQEIYDFYILLKISDKFIMGTKCSCQGDELHQHC